MEVQNLGMLNDKNISMLNDNHNGYNHINNELITLI